MEKQNQNIFFALNIRLIAYHFIELYRLFKLRYANTFLVNRINRRSSPAAVSL